jgi:hypothetical protein
MIYPTKIGMAEAAFGWFVHPQSGYILHFDTGGTDNILSIDAYIEPESALGKIRSKGAYEHSPMPRSGDNVGPEEDLAAVMSLYSPARRAETRSRPNTPNATI